MHVAVTGSSGLIGTALRQSLERDGHRVSALVRRQRAGPGDVWWDPASGSVDLIALEGVDGIVHLAGEGVAAKRWTDDHKKRVLDSRVNGTGTIARAAAALHPSPVLLSGSAIGYYGDRGDEELTERSSPGSGFLAEVVQAWEAATSPAEKAGVRVAHLRTGVVLSAEGGALAKQLPLFKLGLGGRAANGKQWLSWIAIDDQVRAIRFLLEHDVCGPVNLTAPGAVTNDDFTKALGEAVHRPTLLPVPRFVKKLPLGVGPLLENLLMTSARVRPTVLRDAGFRFEHPDLAVALDHVI